MGEKTIYETYSRFPKEMIDGFIEDFFGGMSNPEEAYGATFHTIVLMEDLVTDEIYIKYDSRHEEVEKRYSDKVKEFIKKRFEILSYRRKSDGKPLNSIPFCDMDTHEKELIEKLNSIWKDYQE